MSRTTAIPPPPLSVPKRGLCPQPPSGCPYGHDLRVPRGVSRPSPPPQGAHAGGRASSRCPSTLSLSPALAVRVKGLLTPPPKPMPPHCPPSASKAVASITSSPTAGHGTPLTVPQLDVGRVAALVVFGFLESDPLSTQGPCSLPGTPVLPSSHGVKLVNVWSTELPNISAYSVGIRRMKLGRSYKPVHH